MSDRLTNKLKHETFDLESAESQRFLLFKYIRPFCDFVQENNDPAANDIKHSLDLSFMSGDIKVISYSCILCIFEFIELIKANKTEYHLNLCKGYIVFSMLTPELKLSFGKAYMADMSKIDPERYRGSSPVTIEEDCNPLSTALSSMINLAISEHDFKTLRSFVVWSHSAYKGAHRAITTEVETDLEWIWRLCSLIPWLLVRNFVPVHDSFQNNNPGIYLLEDTEQSMFAGFSDDGKLTRHSVFARNLFTTQELQTLDQEARRMNELFAHSFSIISAGDFQIQLNRIEVEILELANKDKLLALQDIELIYRYNLAIPSHRYLRLKETILSHL